MVGHKNQKDFDDFNSPSHAQNQLPPRALAKFILDSVREDLNPSHKIVFFKLLGIQAFIGILSLALCPQFNISLTSNHEAFHYLHRTFGIGICMLICGGIFIGSGAIFASYLLKRSEIKKILKSKYLYYLAISSTALAGFTLYGADIYLKAASFWFVGAIISGSILFQISSKLLPYTGDKILKKLK